MSFQNEAYVCIAISVVFHRRKKICSKVHDYKGYTDCLYNFYYYE